MIYVMDWCYKERCYKEMGNILLHDLFWDALEMSYKIFRFLILTSENERPIMALTRIVYHSEFKQECLLNSS